MLKSPFFLLVNAKRLGYLRLSLNNLSIRQIVIEFHPSSLSRRYTEYYDNLFINYVDHPKVVSNNYSI